MSNSNAHHKLRPSKITWREKRRRTKDVRRKRAKKSSSGEPTVVSRRDLFSKLPLEVLSEILSMVTTEEVLAVARCCKHLCHTLLNFPYTEFIWRRARKNYIHNPLPDPLPNFTEASYASFVFDMGNCDFCGKEVVKSGYTCLSLRLRFCDNKEKCLDGWMESYGQITVKIDRDEHPYVDWIMTSRLKTIYGLIEGSYGSPGHLQSFCRASEFKKLEAEYQDAKASGVTLEEYRRMHQFHVRKINCIERHMWKIRNWMSDKSSSLAFVKTTNSEFTDSLARKSGWGFIQLLSTKTYRSLYEKKKNRLQLITREDFESVQSTVQSEIEQRWDREERQGREHIYSKLRFSLDGLYKEVCSESNTPVPSLATFYQLPPISELLAFYKTSEETDDNIRKVMAANLESRLKQDLSVWLDDETEKFLRLMGLRKEQAGEMGLDPLKRVTARFNCSNCFDVRLKTPEDVSLDFAQACRHECKGASKDLSKVASRKFVLDEKASRVTKSLIRLLNLSECDTALSALNELKICVRCETCSGAVLLNLKAMQEHCHRHEQMKISLYPEGLDAVPDSHWGLRDVLVRNGRKGSKLRKQRIFACRHCQPSIIYTHGGELKDEVHGNQVSVENRRQTKTKNRSLKVFDFDGVQSHLKSSHGVPSIADEDFYQVEH
ncbi:hypothetical protein SCHPADRAFT_907826 [Schizopora paradoxa]|uniref:F-box domain-containing protein n=1 Tax=Schizopora paradoxa TaxID=27342 RepID=A0A0H2RBR9_9AGAM|nr:hypothetical protein SCHPADRAFT_907826 [Schizopora paradoxa]